MAQEIELRASNLYNDIYIYRDTYIDTYTLPLDNSLPPQSPCRTLEETPAEASKNPSERKTFVGRALLRVVTLRSFRKFAHSQKFAQFKMVPHPLPTGSSASPENGPYFRNLRSNLMRIGAIPWGGTSAERSWPEKMFRGMNFCGFEKKSRQISPQYFPSKNQIWSQEKGVLAKGVFAEIRRFLSHCCLCIIRIATWHPMCPLVTSPCLSALFVCLSAICCFKGCHVSWWQARYRTTCKLATPKYSAAFDENDKPLVQEQGVSVQNGMCILKSKLLCDLFPPLSAIFRSFP